MASLQRRRARCGEDLSTKLAGYRGGRKILRSCLPVTANDERSLKVVQELQELSQELGIERGLEWFPSAKVELNDVELKSIPLHGQDRPTIPLLGVGVDMVDQVPGGM